jgi:hypothetical protein
MLAMVRQKMDKMMRRKELPCVRRLKSLHSGRVVRGAVVLSMEIKKVMKKRKERELNGE